MVISFLITFCGYGMPRININVEFGNRYRIYLHVYRKLLFFVLCIAFKMYLSSHKSHDETLNLNLISQKSHCIVKPK